MAISKLYYGLWSQMSAWSVTLRAAVVLGCSVLIIYLFLMPFWGRFCSVLLRTFDLLIKIVYILLYKVMEAILKTRPQRERAELLNKLSLKAGGLNEKIRKLSKKLRTKRRPPFLAVLFLYGMLISWIALPVWTGGVINDSYIPFLSYGNQIYQKCEKRTLEAAKQYQPLLKRTEETWNKNSAESSGEETAQILSLSEGGRDGANVREKPTKNSRSITIVSGDDIVFYLAQEDGWVRVRLTDDREGWIRDYLLEGVPLKP